MRRRSSTSACTRRSSCPAAGRWGDRPGNERRRPHRPCRRARESEARSPRLPARARLRLRQRLGREPVRDRVSRFSARTNKRQARIRSAAGPTSGLRSGSGLGENENIGSVSRIGPKRNKVVKTIRVGGRPNGVTVAFGSVWVADFGRGRVIRIDPARNKVTGSVGSRPPTGSRVLGIRSGSRARPARSTGSTRPRWP